MGANVTGHPTSMLNPRPPEMPRSDMPMPWGQHIRPPLRPANSCETWLKPRPTHWPMSAAAEAGTEGHRDAR